MILPKDRDCVFCTIALALGGDIPIWQPLTTRGSQQVLHEEQDQAVVLALKSRQSRPSCQRLSGFALSWHLARRAISSGLTLAWMKALTLQRRVQMADIRVPGAEPGLTAPQRHARILPLT
jgi:hypothetical protein